MIIQHHNTTDLLEEAMPLDFEFEILATNRPKEKESGRREKILSQVRIMHLLGAKGKYLQAIQVLKD